MNTTKELEEILDKFKAFVLAESEGITDEEATQSLLNLITRVEKEAREQGVRETYMGLKRIVSEWEDTHDALVYMEHYIKQLSGDTDEN